MQTQITQAKSSFKERPAPGYKQTEVGVVPEEWTIETLGELGKWLSGGTPSMAEKTYWDGSIPWVSPKDMKAPRLYDASDHVSEKALTNGTRLAPQHALLVVVRGMILAHSLPVARAERSLAFNQDIKALITRDSVDSNFLLWWFQANRPALLSLTTESTHGTKRLPSEALFAQRIALPPLSEQKAIAEVLNKADALVECFGRLIAKKRLLKRGVMRELLTGKKRLPGFNGEWEVKRIGEITECAAGGTPSTLASSYWGGSIRWMSSGELNLKLVGEVNGRITEDGLRNCSAKMLPKKCVLIGLAGQGKTRGTVAMNLVELCTNQSIAAIFPSLAFVSEYLYYNLDTRYDELRALSAGDGGRGGLNLTIIKSIPVPLPKIEEQTAIVSILTAMDVEITLLEAQLAKYRQIKQGLMQRLLTGRIRLV
jgi:type I restriction enzyme S subunit